MNVSEILSYDPEKGLKRPPEDPEGKEPLGRAVKAARVARVARGTPRAPLAPAMPQLAVPAVPLDPVDPVDPVDEATLRRVAFAFEKRFLKNREMRVKFSEHPERFLQSELDLFDAVQELRSVATFTEFHVVATTTPVVRHVLELLGHENTDMCTAVLELLQEMTDTEGDALDVLVGCKVVTRLVETLERLDETREAEARAVHDGLAVLESLLDLRPEVFAAPHAPLLSWLLRRLRARLPFDENKLYASEVLAILTQTVPASCAVVGELDGIDTLLQLLAVYKRQDPGSAREAEMMENAFDCLCCLLHGCRDNRDRFLWGEGVQLMNLMLRERRQSRLGSLRVLDHATAGPAGRDICHKLIEVLGLRSVFPLFMKPPRRSAQVEEHVLAIVCSLLRNSERAHRQRILHKFMENDFEKVDRLLELHFKYLHRVQGGEEGGGEDSYLRRLGCGLFALQLVDYILLEVCSRGPAPIKHRAVKIMNLRGGSLKAVKNIMRELAGNLGDAGERGARELEESHIIQLIDKF